MYNWLIIFLLTIPVNSIARDSTKVDKIIYSQKSGWEIDTRKLQSVITEELIKFRRSNGLSFLSASQKSKKISDDQSSYMVKTGTVSHQREGMDFNQRVSSLVGGGHFGENLYYVSTPAPLEIYKNNSKYLKSKYGNLDFMWELDEAYYSELGSIVIKKWIDSPSHYRNLINPLWNFYSVGVSSNGKGIYIVLILEE